MARLTTDPKDPELTRGGDLEPTPQSKAYLVLSDKELEKGFIRPVRDKYVHQYMEDGTEVPYPLVSMKGVKGCGAATTMSQKLAETYARDPNFYGFTYCVGCQKHLPVQEFTWEDHQQLGS